MDLLIRRDWRAPDEKFQFPKTEISPYRGESGARMMLLVVLLVNTVGVVWSLLSIRIAIRDHTGP